MARWAQSGSPGDPANGTGASGAAGQPLTVLGELRGRAVESLLALSVVAVLGQCANFAATLLLAHILAPADFGAISVATLIINAFSLLRNAFIFQTLIHRRERVREAADQMLLLATALGVALCVGVWIGGDWLASFFRAPGSVVVMRLMALAFLVGSVGAIPDTLFEKELRFRVKMWLESAKPALAAVLSVVLALWGLGPASVGWGQLAGALVWTVGMFRLSDYHPRVRVDWPLLRELLDYGRYIFGGALLVFLFTNLDNASIARILGARALGFYAFAFLIAYMPAEVLTAGIVSSILLPIYAKLQGQREAQARAFLAALRYIGYYAAPTCAAIIVLGPSALHLLYGAKWAPMFSVLRVLALYGFAHSYFLVVRNLCNGVGRARLFWRISALQLALALPLLVYAPTHFGIAGTSVLFTVSKVIATAVAIVYGAHLTALAWRQLARPLALPVLASIAAGLAAFALVAALGQDNGRRGWLALGLETTVFVAVYLGLSLALDATLLAETRQIAALARRFSHRSHRPLMHQSAATRDQFLPPSIPAATPAPRAASLDPAPRAQAPSAAGSAPHREQETPMTAPRVLVIGMDGATFRVIDPLIAEGKLPNLARLLRTGVRAPLLSTIPYHTSAAWPTFLTGLQPGSHGIFNFDEMTAGGYGAGARLVTSSAIAGRTFLDVAGEAGLSVAAVRVPMTYPAWPVNGVMVSGYPSPEHGAYTAPRDLAARIPGMRDPSEAPTPEARARLLLDEVQRTTEITCQLLVEHHPDVCAAVYQQSDVAHHWFWRYMDPASPAYTPDGAAQFGDVIARVYEAIDEGIGELLRFADDQTHVLVLSDHGGTLGPAHEFHLNAWLAGEGLLARRAPTAAGRVYALRRYVLPPAARARLKRLVGRKLSASTSDAAELFYFNLQDVDWARTQAFRFAMTAEVEGIMLNVAGRQRHGTVTPGDEERALADFLIARLTGLRAPVDGTPLVRAVYRRDDLYTGERAAKAPDLILVLHPAYRGGRDLSEPLCSPVPLEDLRRNHGGWHEPEGILALAGPGIAPERRASARLLDMAPTVLSLLGLPAAPWMEGAPLPEAAQAARASGAESRPAAPARLPAPPRVPAATAVGVASGAPSAQLSADEEESVRERLRNLGYL